jgi:hypothetical protein
MISSFTELADFHGVTELEQVQDTVHPRLLVIELEPSK